MENPDNQKIIITKDHALLAGVLLLAVIVFCIVVFSNLHKNNSLQPLPFLGKWTHVTIHKDGNDVQDSIPHRVQNFSFVDQTGKQITNDDFNEKIYVADFFFTTCPSICPKMTKQMQRVVETYKNEPRVSFLSHTVFPEHDSVNVLATYAKNHDADANRWHFVTGNKKEIYDMVRTGYLLSADSGDGGKGDFVHTQLFALVDFNRHLRGVYAGTDSSDVNKLIADIRQLLNSKNQ